MSFFNRQGRGRTLLVATAVWIALLAGMSVAGIKYVAVVESDVDAASGASAELNAAEVREITAELRRQAAENLPRDKYSVMTSETVQSMGGAVLEECAEENCVIALGSKIGADYIVRGTVSKFQTMFTLAIELYETENGTLIVSSEAIRSENLVELLNKATTVSANMFRKFAGAKGSTRKEKTNPETIAKKSEPMTIEGRKHDYYIAPKYQTPLGTPVSWGGINVEGGLVWGNGMFLGIDLSLGVDFDIEDEALIGVGISFGNVYDLWGQLQLVYGGSAGYWFAADVNYENDRSAYLETWNFLAPFVKLRWNFIELTYRGLLGIRCMGGPNPNGYGYSADDFDGFSWNNHQLMLGFYFATSKRER